MTKKCLYISALLLLIIAGGIYKFIFQGSTSISVDGRSAIHLTESERALVLTEMRGFLSSVQQINYAIANGDMAAVTEYARKSGAAAQGEVPGTLIGKLPLAFKQLGFDTHGRFDQLAMDAEDMEDGMHALSQLASLMENCVNCHEMYRFETSSND